MPELQHISLILGILIIGGFLMMMQGIKVHGRRHEMVQIIGKQDKVSKGKSKCR